MASLDPLKVAQELAKAPAPPVPTRVAVYGPDGTKLLVYPVDVRDLLASGYTTAPPAEKSAPVAPIVGESTPVLRPARPRGRTG